MRRRAAALTVVLALAACSTTAGGPDAPGSSGASSSPSSAVPPLRLDGDHVLLDFDEPDVLAASPDSSPVQVRRLGDAPLSVVRSGDGTHGLAFPAYATKDEGRLVLLITPGEGARRSGPPGDLVFGADVKLDASTGSGTQDNGDNVVQRGLYADQDQFKLQVDKHVPSCTVRTPRLRAFVKLDHPVDDGWYRLSCRYDGVTLDLTAAALQDGGGARTVASTPANAGALSFASGTGISVGGKVTSTGTLVKNESDQLNGALDNVYVSPSP